MSLSKFVFYCDDCIIEEIKQVMCFQKLGFPYNVSNIFNYDEYLSKKYGSETFHIESK